LFSRTLCVLTASLINTKNANSMGGEKSATSASQDDALAVLLCFPLLKRFVLKN
jgi:hypothetical protein